MDFERALREIGDFLDQRGAPWAVIGGLSLAAPGFPRSSDSLDQLERDLPTTDEDVAVLRRLRQTRAPDALRHPNRLNPPPFVPEPPPRRTFEGAEEFVLE